MHVSDVIFCLRATNTEGRGACAETILTALTPEYIPGLFTFSVIITLLAADTSEDYYLLPQAEAHSLHVPHSHPTGCQNQRQNNALLKYLP